MSRNAVQIKLKELLKEGESIPEEVMDCAERLTDLGVWHTFSRNAAVTSCQDAARRRNRLGHEGIPLWDELKSFLGEYKDSWGRRQIVLAHCRGDKELDLHKLQQALKVSSEIRRLASHESENLGMKYGTVNPFLVSKDAIQVFDFELHHPVGVPGTVMTNAGVHTWAVEFDPAELVVKLPGARWADIIQPTVDTEALLDWGVRQPQTIGIVTGNPSDSGWELCSALNAHVRNLLGKNSLGDVSMPKIVVVSTPQIGISMEMDIRELPLRKELLRAIDELCAAGARILAHPAHTTHYFASEIAAHAAEKGACFISMAEATAERLRTLGIAEIALLGTRYVTDFAQRWSVYRDAFQGVKIHTPSLDGWKKIHDLGYEVQQRGPTPLCFNWMRDLLRDEVPRTCTHVVLAMTEFSPVVRQLKPRGRQGKILIDPIDIYAEAIARQYLRIGSSINSLTSFTRAK